MAQDFVFEKYIKITNNQEFKKVPINTCKSDMYKIYEERKQTSIIILLILPNKIVITSNYWKDLNSNHYFYVTVHCINDN